jgi:hypothetical protein
MGYDEAYPEQRKKKKYKNKYRQGGSLRTQKIKSNTQ